MNEKGPFFAQVLTIVERGEEFLRLLAGMGFSPNQKKSISLIISLFCLFSWSVYRVFNW